MINMHCIPLYGWVRFFARRLQSARVFHHRWIPQLVKNINESAVNTWTISAHKVAYHSDAHFFIQLVAFVLAPDQLTIQMETQDWHMLFFTATNQDTYIRIPWSIFDLARWILIEKFNSIYRCDTPAHFMWLFVEMLVEWLNRQIECSKMLECHKVWQVHISEHIPVKFIYQFTAPDSKSKLTWIRFSYGNMVWLIATWITYYYACAVYYCLVCMRCWVDHRWLCKYTFWLKIQVLLEAQRWKKCS